MADILSELKGTTLDIEMLAFGEIRKKYEMIQRELGEIKSGNVQDIDIREKKYWFDLQRTLLVAVKKAYPKRLMDLGVADYSTAMDCVSRCLERIPFPALMHMTTEELAILQRAEQKAAEQGKKIFEVSDKDKGILGLGALGAVIMAVPLPHTKVLAAGIRLLGFLILASAAAVAVEQFCADKKLPFLNLAVCMQKAEVPDGNDPSKLEGFFAARRNVWESSIKIWLERLEEAIANEV